jgi:hypothetical protein
LSIRQLGKMKKLKNLLMVIWVILFLFNLIFFFLNNSLKLFLVVLQKELEVTLGHINSDLDGRFLKVRTQETNLGLLEFKTKRKLFLSLILFI